jgi:hypothetical protein
MQDFRFLSSRSYFVVHANPEVPKALENGRLEIFTFVGEGTNYPTLVATLGLPELDPDGYIDSIEILVGPSCAKAMPGTPFSKSNESRICMISICYNEVHWIRLLVHRRSLHQYVLDYMREKTTVATIVPWDQWGPQNSRMLVVEENIWDWSVVYLKLSNT